MSTDPDSASKHRAATCPRCGRPIPGDAPGGACPRCGLEAAFDSRSTTRAFDDEAPRVDQVPLGELQRRFPELAELALVGRGGMGTVYRARHRDLDRLLALKVIAGDVSAEFAERFQREARALARLDHPNIVRVHDFGDRDGLLFLTMEYVDGITLRTAIDGTSLTADRALALVPTLCEALQYAHDHGVVHRDIKPENILIRTDGAVKLVDFGLARVTVEQEARFTMTARAMGTPNYMAPEQFERPLEVDHRADIFALGVVLYELLTGELPLGRFDPPSRKVRVDVRLDRVVLKSLEKDPSRRYQLASDMRRAVEDASGPDLGSASGSSWWRWMGARPSSRRHRDPWGARRRPGGVEFTSRRRLGGLPVLDVSFPRDRESGRMRGLARGVVAVGDSAVGVVAVGGIAVGLLAVGGICIGGAGVSGMALSIVAVAGIAAAVIAHTGLGAGVWTQGPRTVQVRDEPLDVAYWTLFTEPLWLLPILVVAALLVALPWLVGRTPPSS